MKNLFLIFICVIAQQINAQDSEKEMIEARIITFFDAFHKQDTTALKSMASGNIKMQSISVNKDGKTVMTENEFFQFVQNIASIPKDQTFEEKLLGFSIQVDGNMANAWTPYEFWYNGNFSHCGVNSFQLMKVDKEWKIIYLVDTRRKEGCQN
jgi:hypothetical protein